MFWNSPNVKSGVEKSEALLIQTCLCETVR